MKAVPMAVPMVAVAMFAVVLGIRLFRVRVSVSVSVGLRGPFPWASVANSVGPQWVSVGFRGWNLFRIGSKKQTHLFLCRLKKCAT